MARPSDPGGAQRRGRPRDPRVEPRIKRAALEQLAEGGLANLSVDRVCGAAGVPRSTFYRRWPSITDLLLDAFDEAARLDLPPETGDLLSDLVAYAMRVAALFADPVFGACMAALSVEARRRPEMRRRLIDDLAERRAHNRRLFERAAARGEPRPDISPDLLLDVINGLALTYGGTGHRPSPEDYELVLRRLLGRGG